MADPFSTTDIVLAVAGIFLVILQFVIWFVNRNLPSVKLRILENTLDETETLLRTCMEEGRFLNLSEAVRLKVCLRKLRARATNLRVVISGAKTYMDEIKYMYNGLSRSSQDVCEEVKEVRANISSCSAERDAYMQGGQPPSRISSTNTISTMVPVPSLQYLPSNLANSETTTTSTVPQSERRGAGGVSVTNTDREGTSSRGKQSRFARLADWFAIALLAMPSFRLRGSPPEPACEPSGFSHSGVAMQPLLHGHQPEPSRRESVSSNKSMGTPSVRRKKQMNALGRARARAHILRRAYV